MRIGAIDIVRNQCEFPNPIEHKYDCSSYVTSTFRFGSDDAYSVKVPMLRESPALQVRTDVRKFMISSGIHPRSSLHLSRSGTHCQGASNARLNVT